MKKAIVMSLIVLSGVAVAEVKPDRIVVNLKGLLPAKWTIVQANSEAVPYNWTIKDGAKRGVALTFSGPTVVKGARGLNDENESFTVWFMPPDYAPIPPKQMAQFEEAKMIGKNEKMKVFVKCFVTDVPSWRKWKEDLVTHFQLREKKP